MLGAGADLRRARDARSSARTRRRRRARARAGRGSSGRADVGEHAGGDPRGRHATSPRGRVPTVVSATSGSAPSSRSIAMRRNAASGEVVASRIRARSRGLSCRSVAELGARPFELAIGRRGARRRERRPRSCRTARAARRANATRRRCVAVSVPAPTLHLRRVERHAPNAAATRGSAPALSRVNVGVGARARPDAEAQLGRRAARARARPRPRTCRRACAGCSWAAGTGPRRRRPASGSTTAGVVADVGAERAAPPAEAERQLGIQLLLVPAARPARPRPASAASSSAVHGPAGEEAAELGSWRARRVRPAGRRARSATTRSAAAGRQRALGELRARRCAVGRHARIVRVGRGSALDLHAAAVAPLAQHEVVALERRVLPGAEPHQRALVAARRRAAASRGAARRRCLHGSGAPTARSPSPSRRPMSYAAQPIGPPAGARRQLAQRGAAHVVVGDRVDVLPARVAVAPVGAGVAEHQRGVGEHRNVPAERLARQRDRARRHAEPEVHEHVGIAAAETGEDVVGRLGQRRDARGAR